MKPIAITGIVLIVLGLAALVYGGINYTSRETVIDFGPIKATADRERTFPLPPVAGPGHGPEPQRHSPAAQPA